MTTPVLFTHALVPHERRHGPRGYAAYDGYKSWLRDEFTFRCVYCLERELWYPDRAASFSVEHVIPQSNDNGLICEYTNLVYACTRCNSARRDGPVLDPTKVAFGDQIGPGEDGILIGLTPDGQALIYLLKLNENPAIEVRRKYLTILSLRERYPTDTKIESLYLKAFGYPEDMPDLRTKRPPLGNSRPGSEQSCYFARREKGTLSATY